MEPKQNCLYAHTAHGLPSPVCHTEILPEILACLHWSQVSHPHMPHGLVMSLSLGLLQFISRSDILHVSAMKMSETKQEDVMEEERDGEERGILAF